MRSLAAAPVLATFGSLTLFQWFRDAARVIVPGMMLAAPPATFLFYDHLRRAAARLPNRVLATQASLLRWLLPPAMVLPVLRLFYVRGGPQSFSEILVCVPVTGAGCVYDFAFVGLLLAQGMRLPSRWYGLSAFPSALLLVWAVAVLVQFRLAFAAAVRDAKAGTRP